MNKFWKWFLIVLGIVVVLGVIAVAIIGFTHGFGRMGFDGGRFNGFDGFHHRYGGFAMPGRPGGFGMMPGMGLIGLLLACFGSCCCGRCDCIGNSGHHQNDDTWDGAHYWNDFNSITGW